MTIILFIVLAAAVFAPLGKAPRGCDIPNPQETEGDSESGARSFGNKTKQYARRSYDEGRSYLEKPENRVAFATLLLLGWYTWLSHKQYVSSGDTEVHQVRAYLGVETFILACLSCYAPNGTVIPEDKIAKDYFGVGFLIKDYGQTPAYGVSLCLKSKELTDSNFLPHKWNYGCVGSNVKLSKTMESPGDDRIGADVGRATPVRDIDADHFPGSIYQRVILGKSVFVFWGQVNYRDVFVRDLTMPFCYTLSDRGNAQCEDHNTP